MGGHATACVALVKFQCMYSVCINMLGTSIQIPSYYVAFKHLFFFSPRKIINWLRWDVAKSVAKWDHP